MARLLLSAVFLFCWVIHPMAAAAQSSAESDAIRYTLRFPAPQTHYVEVEASYPTAGRPFIELMMAVWTPGSYLVREYARHVEDVRVVSPDGEPGLVEKVTRNRWRLATGGRTRVTVHYRVYGREMSVRTNWIESGFAMLNGAPTFLTLVGGLDRPHEVELELPAEWSTAVSGMPSPADRPTTFTAADFDMLVDSPIVAGTPAVHAFEVGGKPHLLVNVNEGGSWDPARAVADVERIVRAHEQFWGGLPYDRYVFLNMITEAGGGLEHANSTLLMTSRWAMGSRQEYVNWLNLVSHEFFHVWNIKRLRPAALGPFDYEAENYTPSLWVSEGFTTYYGDLLVHRAGLVSREEFLASLSGEIRAVQQTPGRLVMPVSRGSFDAWIRHYRPDENSPNVAISYYAKGAVIAALLDARIRTATGNQRSLDDVMRQAYARYSGAAGFTEAQFRALISEVAGVDLTAWLADAVDGTSELSYATLLDTFGLQFAPADSQPGRGWLGLVTRVDAGRLLVSQVRRGTPGFDAGFNVDDEILAIDDFRVRPEQWDRRMLQYPPTRTATVLVARRDALLRLPVTFGQDPGNAWRLRSRPNLTPPQNATQRSWLGMP
jgi:predicted metalloprotease with PDZ domain